jgi:NAD(P)-dependent dehydrogenase (short-subunit alcohol dehydrogenase family)
MPITLVTGTSRGIGREVGAQLKARGDDVIAVCRTASSELSALGVRVVDGIDVRLHKGLEN